MLVACVLNLVFILGELNELHIFGCRCRAFLVCFILKQINQLLAVHASKCDIKVHVLDIKERGKHEAALRSDTSIAAALGRHGIKPEVRSSIALDISVGDEILSRVADLDADLLIMGAYGHSRFRELVFGGVTRHIAKHMTLPTLLSH